MPGRLAAWHPPIYGAMSKTESSLCPYTAAVSQNPARINRLKPHIVVQYYKKVVWSVQK